LDLKNKFSCASLNLKLILGAKNLERIIGFDLQMLIQMGVQFFNTLVCIGILYYFLYKPVRKFISDRENKIAGEILDAKQKLESARKIKQELEKELQEINIKRDEILKVAHEIANQNKNLILKEARGESKRIISQANLFAKHELENAKQELKNEIINIAILILREFLEENLDQEMQNKFINKALKKIGES